MGDSENGSMQRKNKMIHSKKEVKLICAPTQYIAAAMGKFQIPIAAAFFISCILRSNIIILKQFLNQLHR
jgi:hypothetical protein